MRTTPLGLTGGLQVMTKVALSGESTSISTGPETVYALLAMRGELSSTYYCRQLLRSSSHQWTMIEAYFRNLFYSSREWLAGESQLEQNISWYHLWWLLFESSCSDCLN